MIGNVGKFSRPACRTGDQERKVLPQSEEGLETILIEIFFRPWLFDADIHLSDYFEEKDITGLVRSLFSSFLGTWANQKIICVGDKCTASSPTCQLSSIPLYDSGRREAVNFSYIVESLMQCFSCDPSQARLFRERYSQIFEEFFPSNQRYVLLNFTRQEYVASEELLGKTLLESSGYMRPGLGHAAMLCTCWSQDSSTSMQQKISNIY